MTHSDSRGARATGPRASDVVKTALRTYRERFWRVAGTAFVVFGIVAVVDAIATVLIIDRHVSRPIGAAITSVAAGVFAMVGVVIYAGILDKVVGAHLHGHPDLTIREIWHVLPLGRLVVADVVLAVGDDGRTGVVRHPGNRPVHAVVARRTGDHDRRSCRRVSAEAIVGSSCARASG